MAEMLIGVSKPPPSASRPPHRGDFPNDLGDPPRAGPIVQLVVHQFAEPSLLG
jgi:hypothetical protein